MDQQLQHVDSSSEEGGIGSNDKKVQHESGITTKTKSGSDNASRTDDTEIGTYNEKEMTHIQQQQKELSSITNVGTTADIDNVVDDDGNNKSYTLIAKYGKQVLTYDDLSGDVTIGEVKLMIETDTRILSKRQKFVGLQVLGTKVIGGLVSDDIQLSELKVKPIKSDPNTRSKINNNNTSNNSSASSNDNVATSGDSDNNIEIIIHQFILMGTPEEAIFIDPAQRNNNNNGYDDNNTNGGVIDDFDFEYNAGTDEWYNHVSNEDNLRKFTEQTPIHIMNEPRDGKPLLVLDLDHTLLDFSSRSIQRSSTISSGSSTDAIMGLTSHSTTESMKRPYMDHFLATCYQHYDIVVWSQTSWRWLETKLIELGMITNPNYKFCFVLDKTSMFTITSTLKNNKILSASTKSKLSSKIKNGCITHHVKPLQIIWSKFNNRWNCHNTVHIDDLSRNFALNIQNGIKIKAYYRKKASSGRRDVELLALSSYLVQLAICNISFDTIDFNIWSDVAAGRRLLQQREQQQQQQPPKTNEKDTDNDKT